MGLFSSSKSKLKVPGFVTESGDYITKLLKQPDPTIPTQNILGLSDMEQQSQSLLSQYVGTPTGADAQLAKAGMRTTAAGVNPMDTYAPLLAELQKGSALETNRLGRMLQIEGSLSSSTGRDQLGRKETANQQAMLAAMAPMFEAERNRQMQAQAALPGMEQFAAQEPLRRAQAGQADPERVRAQQQADAAYAQLMQQIEFPYAQKGQLALGAIGAGGQYSTVTGGDPSLFSQVAPVLGMAALGMAAGGMFAGGGAGAGTGAGSMSGQLMNPSVAPNVGGVGARTMIA